jgi:cytoskeletal protein CcmA (bactofilin family)
MAQIIKHRRGGIAALKDVTARVGEFVMATGSISNLNGPMVFIGESEGVAGAYRPVSKIYQGSSAPTIDVGAYGSVIDGTPFYATSNKTLYILSKDGNNNINLTGNIEGNTISGLTINKLTGALGLDGDLNMTGNTYQTGSITLTGDVTLRGNINIGDNLTGDTVNINGEISSSLIPALNNTFDLGSTDNAWNDLYVSGTAYIENINLESIAINSISLPGDLNVSGTTILSGSVYVEDLTEKRLVVAGANGLLTNYSGLTFDNGNLNLSGALEVTNIQGTGSLYLKPDLNDGRDFRIYNTAPSDIHIKGNAAYSFFGDDTNYLKIDGNLQTITIDSTNGIYLDNNTSVNGNLYVSGNLEILGTATNVNLESNTVNIGDNIIQVNAYTPFDRYAGLSAYDSGSAGLSGSFLWDATNDYWLVQYSNGNTGKIVSVTTGSMGSEASLTDGTFPIATSNGTIGNSLLTYGGTTLALNSNKFSVDSGTGDTTITGNLTLSYSGGTDNALSSSAIVFRNSSNVLGYVSTTSTTDVMDGILGYKNSNGALVFSTVIDGGSYV